MEQTMKKLPETIKAETKKVTSDQVIQLRLTGKRYVVLKFGSDLYAYRPREAKEARTIRNAFGNHKCSSCANFFANGRLCPKVADSSVDVTGRYIGKYAGMEEISLKESKRIEKYPIILKGVEYFNSGKQYFVVDQCSNYQPNNDTEERIALQKMNEIVWTKEQTNPWFA